MYIPWYHRLNSYTLKCMIEWFQKFWISVFIVVLETRAKGALAALEFRADDRAAMDFLKKRRQVESQSQGWSLTMSAPRTKLLQFQGWIRTDRWLINLYNAAAPGEGTCWKHGVRNTWTTCWWRLRWSAEGWKRRLACEVVKKEVQKWELFILGC